MHIRQPEIAALEPVGQLRVIEAEQVQQRGVQIVDVDRVARDVEAEVVGRAVNVSRVSRRRRRATG